MYSYVVQYKNLLQAFFNNNSNFQVKAPDFKQNIFIERINSVFFMEWIIYNIIYSHVHTYRW